LTAAVAAAAVAVTEAVGVVAGCATAGCSVATGAGAGAAWGVEVGGIVFSDMMPRKCLVVSGGIFAQAREKGNTTYTVELSIQQQCGYTHTQQSTIMNICSAKVFRKEIPRRCGKEYRSVKEGRKRVPRRRREREERKTGEEEGGKSWVLDSLGIFLGPSGLLGLSTGVLLYWS
jgi:hypothetical protein